jgi:hypothetical protein
MAHIGKYSCRYKIILNNVIIEQFSNFNYLGYNVLYKQEYYINIKLNGHVWDYKTVTETRNKENLQFKFDKVMAVPVFIYGNENWAIIKLDKWKI